MTEDPFEPTHPPTRFQKIMDGVVTYWPVAMIGGLIVWYIVSAK